MNNEMNEKSTGPPFDALRRIDDVIDARRKKIALRKSITVLLMKVIFFCITAFIILTFFFGISVMSGEDMYPRMRDGDFVIYYRLEPSYEPGEIITFRTDGERRYGRIVARGGDTVDMTDDGQLVVNGSIQQEEIFFATMKNGSNTEFPLTLDHDEVFVLGDNRTSATDSRDFGAIRLSCIDGKVITLLRRRGL